LFVLLRHGVAVPSRARAQNFPTQQNKQRIVHGYSWQLFSVDWLSKRIWPPAKIWLVYAAACNYFHTDGCIFLAPSHVPQYQDFHTASLYFPIWRWIFHWQKSSQQRKTARHCRTPMKSSIAILILRRKNIIVLLTYR